MSAPLLSLSALGRRFGGLVAVDDVGFEIRDGEIVGLLGPNGSGKTTVLNLVSGALAPTSGAIAFAGRQIAGWPAHRIARLGIARTFQLVRVLPALSCRDNVLAGLAFAGGRLWGPAAEARAGVLLERVGLQARIHAPAGDLTYIDQKRLELARALALEPRLLLLDEWLAGLNPSELNEGIELVRSLRREGLSILLVEHVMDAIRSLCDRCVVMNAGRMIADGLPEAVLAEPEGVRAYLGDDDA